MINQNLREAKYNQGDLKPLADCVLARLLAAKDRGYSAHALFDSVEHVAEEIKQRNWKRMPDGTYQAV